MKSQGYVAVAFFALSSSSMAAQPDAKGIEFFERKIRPVLVNRCYECHAAGAKVKGGLRLDTRAGMLKGGDNGPTLVAGKPAASLLIKAINYDGDLQMPPKGKLSAQIIADFSAWIEMGAPDPRDDSASSERKLGTIEINEARRFWSFQPVRKPEPPSVPGDRATTPIDRFIAAKLAEKGLGPATAADKHTLIRRATFDLLGLPPTPAEIDVFVNDDSADAYAKLVDRLLASPQYGEAQARYWLDVARYAEDQAHTFAVKPYTNAYRYRDWVIDSFNADLPYDRFVKLQIAADLMNDDGSPASHNQRAALGFFGLGAQYYKNSDAAKAAADELDDRVDTLTRGFLGLTVSCARCHDHKFDPIPTQDYYSIAGIFWSSKLADVSMGSKEQQARYQEGQTKVQAAEKKVKDLLQVEKDKLISGKIDQLPQYFMAAWKCEARKLTQADYSTETQAKLDKLDSACLGRFTKLMNRKSPAIPALDAWRRNLPKAGAPAEPSAEVVKAARDFADAVKSTLAKGSDKSKDEMMQSLFGEKGVFPITDAEVVNRMPSDCKKEYETRKREQTEVAKSAPPMPPSAHGLAEAAPVDLNVYIRGNPAKQGEPAPRRFLRIVAGDNPPEFKKGSGRLELAQAIADAKNPLTARVMVNRIWQQHFGRGIVGTPSNFGALGERPTHPELLDYLASRFVECGWSIKQIHREIMLSSAYRQSSERNAQAMQVDPDNRLLWRMSRQRLKVEEFRDALLAVSGSLDRTMGGPTTNLDSASNLRRTVYAKISRHELNGLLRLFDFPDANITSDRRSETTVPQQQLFVLNSAFMANQAKAFAARLKNEANDDGARIRRAFVLAFGRSATDDDVETGLRYLQGKDSGKDAVANKLTRWERYAQALLASNEFLYID
jgi:hypothetical protein